MNKLLALNWNSPPSDFTVIISFFVFACIVYLAVELVTRMPKK